MLSIRNTLVIPLILFSCISLAQQPGSVMNTENKPIYSSSPSINKGAAQSQHCTELYKNMESLKGKPQRHYAAAQRYKMECTTGVNR